LSSVERTYAKDPCFRQWKVCRLVKQNLHRRPTEHFAGIPHILTDRTRDFARVNPASKYPPAKPGALGFEPLKAALWGR